MAIGWGFWRKEVRNTLQARSQFRSKVSILLWDSSFLQRKPRPRAGASGFSTPSLLWCSLSIAFSDSPLPASKIPLVPPFLSLTSVPSSSASPSGPSRIKEGRLSSIPSFLQKSYWKIASVGNLGYKFRFFLARILFDMEIFDSVIPYE